MNFAVNSKIYKIIREIDSEKLAEIRVLGCFVWFINWNGTWIHWFDYDAVKKKKFNPKCHEQNLHLDLTPTHF